MELSFSNICKSFGNKQVLKNLSFHIQSGKALGLLGRNGAGKTTSIRILLGIIGANSGDILFNGKPIDRSKLTFGYLPEERGLYPKKQILSQLCYIGMLKGLDHSAALKQSKILLQKIRLNNLANQKLETLSKGNQQKIQLIAALLGEPQIVVLDEPFSGLDPVNAQLLKTMVSEQAESGKLVIFSSHQMSYVEEFCEHVALLHKGNIVLSGKLDDIKHAYPRNIIYVKIQNPSFSQFAQNCVEIIKIEPQKENQSYLLTLRKEDERNALLKQLIEQGFYPEEFSVVEPSLEQIFVDKAGDEE